MKLKCIHSFKIMKNMRKIFFELINWCKFFIWWKWFTKWTRSFKIHFDYLKNWFFFDFLFIYFFALLCISVLISSSDLTKILYTFTKIYKSLTLIHNKNKSENNLKKNTITPSGHMFCVKPVLSVSWQPKTCRKIGRVLTFLQGIIFLDVT
jgi:hypothetical protein